MFGALFLVASALNGYVALRTLKKGHFDPKGFNATRTRRPSIFWFGVGMYWLVCGTGAAAGVATLLGFGLKG